MKRGVEPAEAGPADIRGAATRWLARREYARVELERRLTRRGFPPELVDDVVSELQEENLLSDERFAESFVSAKAGRGQGPARIRRELRERGVDGALADAALAEADADWLALARAVRTKRFGAAFPRDFPERARQMRFLHYRGFTEAQIRAALGED